MANKYLDLAGATYIIGKVRTLLIKKVDAVDGKGLSTNDYTTAEKNKLSGIAENANKTVAMTGATASAAGKEGSVPAPAAGANTKFLRGDGTWQTPANTTYSTMTGATASTAGKAGLTPAPAAGDQEKFLKADGTWATPKDTTYADATQSAHGLMTAADKKKLDGVADGANKTTVDASLSSSSTNPVQNKVVHAELLKKAPLASPTFTGTPKVPTAEAGTNTTQAASTAFVIAAITAAMSGITGIDFQVVEKLPTTGTKGVFYLIANSGSGQNVYDEYIWVNGKFEKLGIRELDLSGYMKTSDMVAITTTEIDAAFA